MYSPSYDRLGSRRGGRRDRELHGRDPYDQSVYGDNDVEILRRSPSHPSPPSRTAEGDAPTRRFVVNVQSRPDARFEMPSTREPDYVTIKLPLLHQPPSMGGNVTVGLEYQIKPTHIVRFLPNTRRAMRDGILDLDRFFPIDVLRSSPIDEIREACIFIFDFINGWATRGRRDFTDLFDDAILSISRARDQRRAAVEAALRLLSLCVVLHRANGLGCDGQLLDGVGRFADNLFNDWGAYLGIEHQAAVFSAFLGIYVSTSRELRWTMQSIWSKMDWWTRQRVVQRVFRMRNDSESAWEEWVLLMDLEYR